MIPTVILFGLLAGGIAGLALRRSQLPLAACVAVLAALAWGVLVGGADSSFATFAAGTLLAAANIAVGALVGAALGFGLRPRFQRRHSGPSVGHSNRAG